MTHTVGAQLTNPVGASELASSGRGFGKGDRVVTADGKEFLFCVTGGAITGAGFVVTIDEAYSAVQLSTSNDARGDLIGVALSAVTSGDYAWFQVKGVCDNIQVLASCAANVRLNTTGTAGALDDDGTATTIQAEGIYLTTARAASQGNAPGVLNYPIQGVTL
jgi:allophanate hydrolase subunit 2